MLQWGVSLAKSLMIVRVLAAWRYTVQKHDVSGRLPEVIDPISVKEPMTRHSKIADTRYGCCLPPAAFVLDQITRAISATWRRCTSRALPKVKRRPPTYTGGKGLLQVYWFARLLLSAWWQVASNSRHADCVMRSLSVVKSLASDLESFRTWEATRRGRAVNSICVLQQRLDMQAALYAWLQALCLQRLDTSMESQQQLHQQQQQPPAVVSRRHFSGMLRAASLLRRRSENILAHCFNEWGQQVCSIWQHPTSAASAVPRKPSGGPILPRSWWLQPAENGCWLRSCRRCSSTFDLHDLI